MVRVTEFPRADLNRLVLELEDRALGVRHCPSTALRLGSAEQSDGNALAVGEPSAQNAMESNAPKT